jgi:hypothetical protein
MIMAVEICQNSLDTPDLKPSVEHIYLHSWQIAICILHTLFVCTYVPYDSHGNQITFPCTTLTGHYNEANCVLCEIPTEFLHRM